MSGRFIDTNVVVYLASGDRTKADRAETLVADGGGTISVQVLNELANVARRKMRLSWTETHAFLSTIRALLPAQPLTLEVHETGLDLAERYGLSIYDAMIAASALHAHCDTLWSEDMEDGMTIEDTLHIVNPFRATGCRGTSTNKEWRCGRSKSGDCLAPDHPTQAMASSRRAIMYLCIISPEYVRN